MVSLCFYEFKKIKDAVAKRLNAAVCKTVIRGFESRPRLQILRSNIAGVYELLHMRRDSNTGREIISDEFTRR